jgi:hypothetical protein
MRLDMVAECALARPPALDFILVTEEPAMAEPAAPQTFANHRRMPPAAWAIAFVVLTAEVVHRIVELCRYPSLGNGWEVLVVAALVVIAFFSRHSPQVVQDRSIRHEMRLRLARVLPAERHGEIARLSVPQLVALRFASDAELPALVAETLAGTLAKPDDIKRKITSWQADWLRV